MSNLGGHKFAWLLFQPEAPLSDIPLFWKNSWGDSIKIQRKSLNGEERIEQNSSSSLPRVTIWSHLISQESCTGIQEATLRKNLRGGEPEAIPQYKENHKKKKKLNDAIKPQMLSHPHLCFLVPQSSHSTDPLPWFHLPLPVYTSNLINPTFLVILWPYLENYQVFKDRDHTLIFLYSSI